MIRLLSRSALVFALVLAGCGDDDPASPGTPRLLTDGTPVTNLSGRANSLTHFRIPVPTGATRLTVVTTGGTGAADIYVRRGTPPTATSIDDCDSLGFTNDETCEIPNPAPDDWFIAVHGSEAYSGLTLTATITRP